MSEETEQSTEIEAAPDLEETTTEDAEDAESPHDSQLEALTATLSERDARIAQLEAALGEAQSAVQSREQETEAVNARLAQAVELYRASLLAAEPDLPEDMVHGSTVETVQESLERARQNLSNSIIYRCQQTLRIPRQFDPLTRQIICANIPREH